MSKINGQAERLVLKDLMATATGLFLEVVRPEYAAPEDLPWVPFGRLNIGNCLR